MQELKDFLKIKKNVISLLTFAVLALALPLGLNLIKTQKIFFSRAEGDAVTFVGSNIITKPNGDKAFILNAQGQAVIGVNLVSPLGPPANPTQASTVTTQRNLVELAQSVIPKEGLVKTAYAQGTCRDNPVSPPAGYIWKANCGGSSCSSNGQCPQNDFDKCNVSPTTSNWCFGFEGPNNSTADWRCLQLVRNSCTQSGQSGCTGSGSPSTCPGQGGRPTCNTVSITVSPGSGDAGSRTFSWTGNSSTYFSNSFSPSGSVSGCNTSTPNGGSASGGSGTCTVTSSGTWTRTWKNCVGTTSNPEVNCSPDCTTTASYTVNGTTPPPPPPPPPGPTGHISANPNPVPGGSGLGTSTISWSTSNVSHPQVRVYEPSGNPTCSPTNQCTYSDGLLSGSQAFTSVQTGHTYIFKLYNGGCTIADCSDRPILDSVTVTTTTPPVPTCTDFSPQGISSTGGIDGNGRRIFRAADSNNHNVVLQATRTPSNATIDQPTVIKTPSSAPDLAFNRMGNGNLVMNVPVNTSTTADNVYTLDVQVTQGSEHASCPGFVLEQPKTGADRTCTYTSTELKFKGQSDNTWRSQNQHITAAQTIRVAGFHDRVTPAPPPNDITITWDGPDGSSGTHIQDTDFTPASGAGDYTFHASTINKDGGQCSGTSVLHVDRTPSTTATVKVAESRQALATTTEIFPYTIQPLNITHAFSDKTAGVKTIFVQFIAADGTPSDPIQKSIELILTPQITSCRIELSGNQVSFEVRGQNFGRERGTSGQVKVNETALTPGTWSENRLVSTLQNPSSGQAFKISVKNDGGLTSDEVTCSTLSKLAVSGKLFCRLPNQHDQDNVTLTLVGTVGVGTSANIGIGGTAAGRITTGKVKILRDGSIEGLNANLIEGQVYKMALKAPKSLRKVTTFTALPGTTTLSSVSLPIGDIFPVDGGDGVINSADRAELNRQWGKTGSNTKTCDFNLDGVCNAFEWACMRNNFGESDESEPSAGP